MFYRPMYALYLPGAATDECFCIVTFYFFTLLKVQRFVLPLNNNLISKSKQTTKQTKTKRKKMPNFQLIYIHLNCTANEINIFASSACWVMSTWCTGNKITTQNHCATSYFYMHFIFEMLSLLFNSFYNFCTMRNDWRFVGSDLYMLWDKNSTGPTGGFSTNIAGPPGILRSGPADWH